MRNLEMYGVETLNTQEMRIVDGGGVKEKIIEFIVSYEAGSFVDYVRSGEYVKYVVSNSLLGAKSNSVNSSCKWY